MILFHYDIITVQKILSNILHVGFSMDVRGQSCLHRSWSHALDARTQANERRQTQRPETGRRNDVRWIEAESAHLNFSVTLYKYSKAPAQRGGVKALTTSGQSKEWMRLALFVYLSSRAAQQYRRSTKVYPDTYQESDEPTSTEGILHVGFSMSVR